MKRSAGCSKASILSLWSFMWTFNHCSGREQDRAGQAAGHGGRDRLHLPNLHQSLNQKHSDDAADAR